MLRQKNIPWLGKLVDSLYTALPALSILNFLSVTTVLYTSTREYLIAWIPWLNIYWFLLFLFLIVTCSLVIVYTLVALSLWSWRSSMMHGSDISVVVDEVRALKEEVRKLREEREGE